MNSWSLIQLSIRRSTYVRKPKRWPSSKHSILTKKGRDGCHMWGRMMTMITQIKKGRTQSRHKRWSKMIVFLMKIRWINNLINKKKKRKHKSRWITTRKWVLRIPTSSEKLQTWSASSSARKARPISHQKQVPRARDHLKPLLRKSRLRTPLSICRIWCRKSLSASMSRFRNRYSDMCLIESLFSGFL